MASGIFFDHSASSSLRLPSLAHFGFFTPPQQKLQKARIRQLPVAFGGPWKAIEIRLFPLGDFFADLWLFFTPLPIKRLLFSSKGMTKTSITQIMISMILGFLLALVSIWCCASLLQKRYIFGSGLSWKTSLSFHVSAFGLHDFKY